MEIFEIGRWEFAPTRGGVDKNWWPKTDRWVIRGTLKRVIEGRVFVTNVFFSTDAKSEIRTIADRIAKIRLVRPGG